MSTPNPLVPHGSNLEQAARSKSTLSIAAFIVGAHAAVFLGLLLIGCRRENNESGDLSAATNTVDSAVQPGTLAGDTNSFPTATNLIDAAYSQPITYPGVGGAQTNAPGYSQPAYNPPGYAGQPAVQGDPYAQPNSATPALPESYTAAPAAGSEYKIKSGDIAYNIAKKNGISIKALKDANPGVDLGKLKIGQTISVPGAAPATTPAVSTGDAASTPVTSTTTYSVKSGDTLTKIAKKYGTTAKAIRKANSLTSDVIKAGQKLKIPTKTAATSPVPATNPEPTPVTAPAYAPPGYNPPAYSQPGVPQ